MGSASGWGFLRVESEEEEREVRNGVEDRDAIVTRRREFFVDKQTYISLKKWVLFKLLFE